MAYQIVNQIIKSNHIKNKNKQFFIKFLVFRARQAYCKLLSRISEKRYPKNIKENNGYYEAKFIKLRILSNFFNKNF